MAIDMADKVEVISKNKKCQARCTEQNIDSSKQIEDLRAEIMEMKTDDPRDGRGQFETTTSSIQEHPPAAAAWV